MTFLATCIAAVPTPLEAERMRAVSQDWSFALLTRMFQLGRKTVGSAAASSYETESGSLTALTAGALRSSA